MSAGCSGRRELVRDPMPGRADHPFAFMARCSCFVLSSAFEVLPNVLVESLALGCSIVSTDCPRGPQ